MANGEHKLKVFGFSSTVEPVKLLIAFFALISYILIASKGLGALDAAIENTAWKETVASLYKELVILAISSFCLTIIVAIEADSNSIQLNDWIVYIEVADITIFITALIHVIFSSVMMVANSYHLQQLREQLASDVVDIVEKFDKTSWLLKWKWNLFSGVRSQIELRILKSTFLKSFNLSRQFNFARYVTIAEETNIIRMLEVTPTQWCVFLVVFAAVLLPIAYSNGHSMQNNEFIKSLCLINENHDRYEECLNATVQIFFFTCGSTFLLMFTIIMAFVSRLYELRLLLVDGINSDSEMSQHLLNQEMNDLERFEDRHLDRMSILDIKNAVNQFKNKSASRQNSYSSSVSEKALQTKRSFAHLWHKSRIAGILAVSMNLKRNQTNQVLPKEVDLEMNSNESSTPFSPPQSIKRTTIIDSPSVKLQPSIKMSKSHKQQAMTNNLNHMRLMHGGISDSIFIFEMPELYFFFRDICNHFQSLFLAFYVTTICVVTKDTEAPATWNGIIVALLACAAICHTYTIRSSSLIYGFYKCDPEILGKVIEEEEEAQHIEYLLRQKLLNKLTNAVGTDEKAVQAAVLQLFDEIQCLDGQSDGYISQSELRALLQRLNIHFTSKRFEDAFSMFDFNADGMISLSEFYGFIFPDVAQEKNRRNRIKKISKDNKNNAVVNYLKNRRTKHIQYALEGTNRIINEKTKFGNLYSLNIFRRLSSGSVAKTDESKSNRNGMCEIHKRRRHENICTASDEKNIQKTFRDIEMASVKDMQSEFEHQI